jgi:hypothetical protein
LWKRYARFARENAGPGGLAGPKNGSPGGRAIRRAEAVAPYELYKLKIKNDIYIFFPM